jgi:hypothetical protein
MRQPSRPVRPYVAADSLTELTGPTSGVIVLSRRLNWGPPRAYDLSDDADTALMYEAVLNEARRAEDVRRYLNGPTLQRLWGRLVLPPQVRTLWEQHIPELHRQAAA